jgi:hypothetical protein
MTDGAQTLREELRKVQSGMLMSDKQRNPGVGCACERHSCLRRR